MRLSPPNVLPCVAKATCWRYFPGYVQYEGVLKGNFWKTNHGSRLAGGPKRSIVVEKADSDDGKKWRGRVTSAACGYTIVYIRKQWSKSFVHVAGTLEIGQASRF